MQDHRYGEDSERRDITQQMKDTVWKEVYGRNRPKVKRIPGVDPRKKRRQQKVARRKNR